MPVDRIPPAPRTWHKRARDWYNSLKTSGQSKFYQDSDWQKALMIGDIMTYMYNDGFAKKAILIQTIDGMMANLGTTEGDRRGALRIELEDEAIVDESVRAKAMAFYAKEGLESPQGVIPFPTQASTA